MTGTFAVTCLPRWGSHFNVPEEDTDIRKNQSLGVVESVSPDVPEASAPVGAVKKKPKQKTKKKTSKHLFLPQ